MGLFLHVLFFNVLTDVTNSSYRANTMKKFSAECFTYMDFPHPHTQRIHRSALTQVWFSVRSIEVLGPQGTFLPWILQTTPHRVSIKGEDFSNFLLYFWICSWTQESLSPHLVPVWTLNEVFKSFKGKDPMSSFYDSTYHTPCSAK